MRYLFILAVFFVITEPLSAMQYRPLTSLHTNYGVSQLNYGQVCCAGITPGLPTVIRLMNPIKVTQVAAVIVYENRSDDINGFLGNPGVYVGCTLRKLSPHSSIGINRDQLPQSPVGPLAQPSKYVEVIWAPEQEVGIGYWHTSKMGRIADGLGGYFSNAHDGQYEGTVQLANPRLFSLPSDDIVPGQKQAAVDCICEGLSDLNLSGDIFSEFGIGPCPDNG